MTYIFYQNLFLNKKFQQAKCYATYDYLSLEQLIIKKINILNRLFILENLQNIHNYIYQYF